MRSVVLLRGLWNLSVCGLACWGTPPAPAAAATGPAQPNIILILADDLGYGDLGCYGQTRMKTPNLDALAAEGMRFTSFYAGSTVCAPSRCALMTGLHTGHAWIRGNAAVALRAQDRTVARILKEAGYHTGLVGKWGLGDETSSGVPQKHGFDEFIGFLNQHHAHNYYPDYLLRYDPLNKVDGRIPFPQNAEGQTNLYVHSLFTVAALNFLQLNKPDPYNRFRPFFLFLAYTIPHANNEEGARSGNGMQVPSDAPYTTENWPQPEKNKAAMIALLDRDIGKIMARLKELKIDGSTVVFFSSDNGPHKEGGVTPDFFQSGGPLRGIKRDLYEGGIRVPLIVRWPGRIKPGSVNPLPAAFWDFLPTAAEIAGCPSPGNLDGVSFLPTLLGEPQTNRHEALYWEFHERGFQQAVRMGNWKAVRPRVGKPLQLYNLAEDIGEKLDVAAAHPEVVGKIERYLESARTENEHWPVRSAEEAAAAKKRKK
jgi:arylsulfatase A-like enzyme